MKHINYKKSSINYLNKYLLENNVNIENLSLANKTKLYCNFKNINFDNIKNISRFLKLEFIDILENKNSKEYKVSKEYNDYLKSKKWRNIRKQILKERDFTCERCGLKPIPKLLHVHHKTYDRIFNEQLSDLELVCKNCHIKIHNNKKIKKSKAKNSVYTINKEKTKLLNDILN